MTTDVAPVDLSIDVPLEPEAAFDLYARSMGEWWPPEHHIGESDLADVVVEGRDQGAIYEVGVDGATCRWGTVLVWDPPGRLVYAWQLNGRWEHDPDLARASEVEVTFTGRPDGGTTVTLQHRHFERHGPDGTGIAEAVAGDQGWPYVLGRYAARSSEVASASA